jgi:hypothetical protein
MDKALIVLNSQDLLRLEEVCLDQDPEIALKFVLEVVAPKITHRAPCLDKIPEIMPFER